MSNRIDAELTSARDDGTWTWRAAGARKPKGVLDASLLPDGTEVGDVVRIDVDIEIDGIVVNSVLPPKGKERAGDREVLEIIGSAKPEPGVTTNLVGGRGRSEGGRDGRRNDRGPSRDRNRRGGPGGPRSDGDRGRGGDRGRDGGDRDRGGDRGRGGGGDRDRSRGGDRDRTRSDRGERSASTRPAPPSRPKPKRLRPKRTQRQAMLATLAPEQQPIAEALLAGGIPAVRAAIDKQNAQAGEAGTPPIPAEPLLDLAEQLLPHLRAAEWRDRAEAALEQVGDVDLRDLRSVVVAADGNARDEESRQLVARLQEALAERVQAEHAEWLAEIVELLDDSRVVRALRVSSRPPKAGAPFPAELATRLSEATTAAMTADTASDRFATVVDALAHSPVRAQAAPQSLPAKPSDALLTSVRNLADRVPLVAAAFGVEPAPPKKRSGGRRRPAQRPPKAAAAPGAATPSGDGEADRAPAPGAAAPESAAAPAPEAAPPANEAPAPDAAVPQAAQPVDGAPAPAVEAAAEPATHSTSTTPATAPPPSGGDTEPAPAETAAGAGPDTSASTADAGAGDADETSGGSASTVDSTNG